MQIAEAMDVLRRDRDLCNFNPMTGEEQPMNEDCRLSAEAYDTILNEWYDLKYKYEKSMDLIRQANAVIGMIGRIEREIENGTPQPSEYYSYELYRGMAQRQSEIMSIIQRCKKEAFSANG